MEYAKCQAKWSAYPNPHMTFKNLSIQAQKYLQKISIHKVDKNTMVWLICILFLYIFSVLHLSCITCLEIKQGNMKSCSFSFISCIFIIPFFLSSVLTVISFGFLCGFLLFVCLFFLLLFFGFWWFFFSLKIPSQLYFSIDFRINFLKYTMLNQRRSGKGALPLWSLITRHSA